MKGDDFLNHRKRYETDESFMIDIDTACKRYSVGRASMRKIAREANALVYFGRCLRVLPDKVDEYLTKKAEGV